MHGPKYKLEPYVCNIIQLILVIVDVSHLMYSTTTTNITMIMPTTTTTAVMQIYIHGPKSKVACSDQSHIHGPKSKIESYLCNLIYLILSFIDGIWGCGDLGMRGFGDLGIE